MVAVGTGQAIRLARSGDADVLLVHHRPSEEKFVAEGFGVERLDVMYNDFVLVGPKDDPAAIKGMTDVAKALAKVAESEAVFVSRGDDSGTHKKEMGLWRAAGVDAAAASGSWYRESGSGMGATLNTAAAMSGYALSDRGTWLSFKNRGDLEILVASDERLFNPYGVIVVNEKKHPHVKTALGQAFVDWLVSPDGQAAIADVYGQWRASVQAQRGAAQLRRQRNGGKGEPTRVVLPFGLCPRPSSSTATPGQCHSRRGLAALRLNGARAAAVTPLVVKQGHGFRLNHQVIDDVFDGETVDIDAIEHGQRRLEIAVG